MARRRSETEGSQPRSDDLVDMTARIVAAYVHGNRAMSAEVPAMVSSVHSTLAQLAVGATVVPADLKPAVPVKKSATDDYIVCLEDGRRLTMLKRYLRTHFNMSPEEYRKKWDLPPDYPMVAPAYARLRSAFAKKIGLGKTPVSRRRK